MAFRGLRKSPVFTAIAVATLALAIGANASIFSVVRAVLLRPLPFPEPDRLVQLWETRLDRGWTQASFTRANFWDLQDVEGVFDHVGAMSFTSFVRTGGAYPQRLGAAVVSSGFLAALGATPTVGRSFLSDEDRTGEDGRVVMLGHALWLSDFGADPAVVGTSITLDDAPYEVVGVLPDGEPWLDAADVFVPMVRPSDPDRGSFELAVVGRLAPGVSVEGARARLDALANRLAERYPQPDAGMGIIAEPSSTWIASDTTRRALWVLMGAVGVLLLIGCANVANLLLARGAERMREHALEAALGASRRRLIGRVVTEAAVLSAVGAALGLALAVGVSRVVRVYDPGDIPRLSEAGLDPWVVGFAVLTAVASTLLASVLPALQAPRVDVAAALRDGEGRVAGSRRLGRLRSVLVGAEVAMSLALLVGAGLLVRSLGAVLGVDRGFATEHRLLFEVGMSPDYDRDAMVGFLTGYLDRVGGIPGVRAAAAVSQPPLSGGGTGLGFGAADAPDDPEASVPWASWRLITGDYFTTLGIPLVDGRTFDAHDRLGDPWRAIVSQSVAERLWPGQRAIGRTVILWKGQDDLPAEVVGVVGDIRERDLASEPTLAVYLPLYGATWSPLTFVAHHDRGATTATIVPLLRERLKEVDAGLPLGNVRTFDDLVGHSVASRRFTMLLMAALAAVALALSLAGVYGVISYATSKRTAEIGVRLALGSAPGGVVRLIVGEGLRPVVIGLGAGLGGAWALSGLMSSLLFGVTNADAPTYVAVAVVLLGAAVVACWLPARRALRLPVSTALRGD